MPDPVSLSASLAPPGMAPTSPLRPAPGGRSCRYEVREVLWGNQKRFLVRDAATDTTVAIRTSYQIADSDLMRLNMARSLPTVALRPTPPLSSVPLEQDDCGVVG